MNIAPGATFESFSPEFASGLAGTVGVRIRDGAGSDFLARTTAGITADTTVGATSVYRKSLTAPTTAGQYWIIWDDGTTLSDPVELVVTASAADLASGTLYVTRDAIKQAAALNGESFADDDIDLAVEAASRAVDGYKGTRFYATAETRYYTAGRYDRWVAIDDLVTLTAVTLDEDGDGTYETTWAEGTDFVLDPANAALESRPARRLVLLEQAARAFPVYRRSIKVEGSFGWSGAPALVQQAAKILALRLLVRSRQAPLGIVTVGNEVGATARLGRIDPDVAFLLDQIPGASSPLFV